MVQIEGLYSIVKSQEFVDFFIELGADKDETNKILGTHWSMKVWKDGQSWGSHISCEEIPEMDCVESFTEGEEKVVDHALFGGKGKLYFSHNSTGDGFTTFAESEKFGKITWEEKYTDEGVQYVISCKDKSVTEFWERKIVVCGTYLFDKAENTDEYFKAVGYSGSPSDFSLSDYKVEIIKDGDTFTTKEFFGDGKCISNTLTLFVEGPFHYPDDKDGPIRTAVMTKTGHGKYLTEAKCPNGVDENWTMTFTSGKLVLAGEEKKSGQTCKIFMTKDIDITGTYKIVGALGFEKCAEVLGLSADYCKQLSTDPDTKMMMEDLGDGRQRHQFITKNGSVDVTLKLGEEITFFHPIFNEEVKATMTKDGNCCTTVQESSKGTIVATNRAFDGFLVSSCNIPAAGLSYQIIIEKC